MSLGKNMDACYLLNYLAKEVERISIMDGEIREHDGIVVREQH